MTSEFVERAMKREKCDLVLKNAKVVDVFNNRVIEGDVGLFDEYIVGIGNYEGYEEIDLKGMYLSPSFVDAHVHIESSMVSPEEFSNNVLPLGTTSIIADPHEIANVCGLDGIKYILDASEDIPLDVYVMLPSCVPATPNETSGAVLLAEDLRELIEEERVLGIGEVMNYPGVVYGAPDVMDKLDLAKEFDKLIDGHGPVIKDETLNAYIGAGVGTDHECTTVEEMEDRISRGMYIQMREGTVTRDVKNLCKGLTKDNMRRCIFCTDDRHPDEILDLGHINNNINIAIGEGVDFIDAIKIASLNACEAYGLKGKGAIAPGYLGDMVVFEDPKNIKPKYVFKSGELVAEDGLNVFISESVPNEKVIKPSILKEMCVEDLSIPLDSNLVNVIGVDAHTIVTKKLEMEVPVVQGKFDYKGSGLNKIVVVERHGNSGNVACALIKGIDIEGGAISSTVSHDSHNLIIVGDNDEDILNCINHTREIKGGISISKGGKIIGDLQLLIGGLMSTNTLEEVRENLRELRKLAKEVNISENVDPFMTLAFMSLPVIPQIKITDKGLFDIDKFDFIDIEVGKNE